MDILPTAPAKPAKMRDQFGPPPRREASLSTSSDQFSASAIQRVLVAGSRFASCLHNAGPRIKLQPTGHWRPLPESSFISAPNYDRTVLGTIALRAILRCW